MNIEIFAHFFLGGLAGLFAGILLGWAIQRRESTKLASEIFASQELIASLKCDFVRAEAEIANKDTALTQYRSAVEKVEERFTDAFENLANRILVHCNIDFGHSMG